MTPTLEKYDIVQIAETHPTPAFRYCLMVVTEPKSWGAQGYVNVPGKLLSEQGAPAFVRVKFADMEVTGGRVTWASA